MGRLPNTELLEVSGENGLIYPRWRNVQTGEETEYRSENGESFGVFVFAWYEPASSLVKGLVELEKTAAAMQRKTGLQPQQPARTAKEPPSTPEPVSVGGDSLFTPEMRQQLETVFALMERPLRLALYLDERPVSAEAVQCGGARSGAG